VADVANGDAPEAQDRRREATPTRSRAWLGLLVALAAALPAVWRLAPAASLLDSAELAEQAFGLGVAHPPGEPVAALWGRLWAYLPTGSIALRVAFGQAVAAGLAAWCVFDVACLLVALTRGPSATGAKLAPSTLVVCAIGTLPFAWAPGLLLSAIRPEVYALQAVLSLGALALALRAAQARDARLYLPSAALIGLGVANHPLIAGLAGLGPAALALVDIGTGSTRAGTSRDRLFARLLVASLVTFTAAAALIVYLPCRTWAAPTLLWGDARTWSGAWWILAAKAFASRAGVVHAHAEPTALPFVLIEELGLPFVLVALAGAWIVARWPRPDLAPGTSRAVVRGAWLGAALTGLGAGAAALTAGFDPANPDIRGYLLVALAAVAWPASAAAALLVGLRRRVVLALAVAAAGGLFVRDEGAWRAGPRLAEHVAEDLVTTLLDTLPARAVFLSSDFETAFLAGYARTVEGRRPDVAWAHLGFFGGPGYLTHLAAREPSLAALADAARDAPVRAADGPQGRDERAPTEAVLDELARARPVFVEADEALTQPWVSHFARAAGPTFAWGSSSLRPADQGQTLHDFWRARGLAPDILSARDATLRGYVGWRLYNVAAVECARGFGAAAARDLTALRALLPDDARAAALEAACRGGNLAM